MKQVHFGNYHSYVDFSLILSSKTIEAPEPKTESVEVPGSDGIIDLSDYFGEIKYKNRSLTFEFTAAPQIKLKDFLTLFSKIQNAIHGKRLKIVLDDDPDFYYIGRVSVNEWKTDKNIGKITVECDCEPYKYKLNPTVIALNVVKSADYTYTNLRKTVVPTITADAEMQITFNRNTYSISPGVYTIPEIAFSAGNNIISYAGTGNVIVEYQEGGL